MTNDEQKNIGSWVDDGAVVRLDESRLDESVRSEKLVPGEKLRISGGERTQAILVAPSPNTRAFGPGHEYHSLVALEPTKDGRERLLCLTCVDVPALLAQVDQLCTKLSDLHGLAAALGAPAFNVLEGREYPEHGPGVHVMGCEGHRYSLTLGSNDAPAYRETVARARVLRELLELATEPLEWHDYGAWEDGEREAQRLVKVWRNTPRFSK